MSFRGTSSGQSGNAYERTLKSSKSLSGSNSTDSEPSHKLVLVGDSGVGKSCLLEKLLDMSSTNNFISTIGVDVKNHAIKAEDGRLVRLQVTFMGKITNTDPWTIDNLFSSQNFLLTLVNLPFTDMGHRWTAKVSTSTIYLLSQCSWSCRSLRCDQ